MRDTSLIEQSGGVLHGYSKTDESHAKEIFKHLNVEENKRLLDVGCGKGAFLREAVKEPFGRVVGIEYSEKMVDIAKRNFKKLRLSERVEIYQGDAGQFSRYGEYNVFYFFNPFDSSIMTKVMKRIVDSQKETNWIILHNPTCSKVIDDFGGKEICYLHCNVKSYDTIIYELEKKC